jgi:asparagine synthase (glutamine-hydrolysing)
MCGIYGVLDLQQGDRLPESDVLKRMGAVTVHRGPDDEGSYVDEQLLLGMRRLSIIDVAGGHQPIANEDRTVWAVCNGEIYNFRELRTELQRRGHAFETGSDTEVLVHLYEEHGDGMVARLSGMFAFALWDAHRRRLLVGRDRLGIKPLYYCLDGPVLIFASEAKAIVVARAGGAELDPVGLEEYLALGYTPAPYSLLKGVRKLPPASLLVGEGGRARVERYWRLPVPGAGALDAEDWGHAFLETMERAVVSQMVSDVPLGAFLSGGIDSSTIVGFMARHSAQPVKTYAIGFDDRMGGGYYNELPYARRVAAHFGSEHREIIVRPDVVRLLPKLLWHLDEPVADSACITTYLVAEFARRDVTVILSGVGGDELFGGYRRYLGAHLDGYYQRLPRWARAGLRQSLLRVLPSDRHSPILNFSRQVRAYLQASELPFEERYRAYIQVLGRDGVGRLLRAGATDAFDALGEAFREVPDGDALARLFRVDLLTQLPDDLLMLTDRMTMAASLECRVPWLDDAVVELAARMPSAVKIRGRELKHVLKRALRGFLPNAVLRRTKRGFGAPVGGWLKHDLAPLLKSVLSRESVERRGLLRWEPVAAAVARHQASREDHTDHLFGLISLELWCRLYLDGRSPDDVTDELVAGLAR